MRLSNKFKSKSLFRKLVLSYIIVTIIPLIFSVVIYFESAKVIENEIKSTNDIILTQVKEVVDNNIDDMRQLIIKLALNTRVNTLMHVKDLKPQYRYTISQLVDDFRNYAALSGFIDSFYIYFNEGGYVVSSSAYYQKDIAYSVFHGHTDMSEEEWHELLASDYEGIVISEHKAEGDNQERQIYYMTSLPMEGDRALARIVVMLDQDRINGLTAHIDWLKQGSFFIVANDQILMNTDIDEHFISAEDLMTFTYDQGVEVRDINGKKAVISYVTSSELGWKCFYVVPMDVFMRKARYVLTFTSISLIISLVVGVLIAVLFAFRDYSSIDGILRLLRQGNDKNRLSSSEDEIQTIKNSIKVMNTELSSQKDIVSSSFIKDLLSGRLSEKTDILEACEANGIDSEQDAFGVVIFDPEKIQPLIGEGYSYKENVSLLKFTVLNILRDLSEQGFQFRAVDHESSIIVLVSSDDGNNALDRMDDIVNGMREFCLETMGLTFTISVSNFYESVEDIRKAFTEAQKAIDYKMVIGKNRIIFYDEIELKSNNYRYSLETERSIINFVKNGSYDKAVEMIDDIFRINMEEGKISIDMAKCLLFDMIGTMIKAMEAINYSGDSAIVQKEDPLERLMACDTVEEMRIQLRELLNHICQYVNDHKQDTGEIRKNKVIDYIEKNCHDGNLNVSAIANHFGMNRSYLSKTFKEQIGISILDYINKSRIKKVKELLDNGSSVSEAADSSGYNNSVSLIRAFKKYEGITPGEYKKLK